MEGSNCDGNGGWMRVGYINMTQPQATCPEGLYKYTLGSLAVCDRQNISTFFSSNGLQYTKVCGQIRGYQYACYLSKLGIE